MHKKRALRVIQQLRDGEWEFCFNSMSGEALTASRKGVELWCGNGGFFTDIRPERNYFGFFWRHIVWWFGVRRAKKEFEASKHAAINKDVDKVIFT